jgi:hypothetical protein
MTNEKTLSQAIVCDEIEQDTTNLYSNDTSETQQDNAVEYFRITSTGRFNERLWNERSTLITMKTPLLCREGCGVQPIVKVKYATPRLFTLACGHQRGKRLPRKGISVEDIGCPLADRLFPPDLITELLRNVLRSADGQRG